MSHDVSVVLRHYTDFLSGLGNTLWLTVATLVLASLLGCIVAGLLLSPMALVKRVISVLVDGLRCIPFLLLVYLIYYGLPELGVRLDRWTTALGALVIYHSAYIGEIIRGAWMNLSKDQIEAGRAFGYSGFRLFHRIVLPQLFFASAPLIGNQAIYIMKDTAFLMIITIPELTFAASSVQSTYFVPFASFIAAVLLYWLVTLVIESSVRRIEYAANLRRA